MGHAVLVVEDEAPIRTGICDLLAYHGHQPTGVDDGARGLDAALAGRWDLVMLDVMLPGMDGFSVCRNLREARPSQAILMLTAKGREADVLEGFRAGCDDYVTKPFSVAQLMARVEALLRRAAADRPATLAVGPVEIDSDGLLARAGGTEVALTRRDVEVLTYLAQERHRVVSREDLLREVWGYARVERVQTRCVDMHLVKLRRKLAEVVGDATLIETVRGAGYRLNEER